MTISFSWQLSISGEPAAGSNDARDMALDPADDDLLIVDGDFVLLRGVEAIASDLRSRLQTFAGEYFLDTSIGVPWLRTDGQYPAILGGKPSKTRSSEILRALILETPGVVELLAFGAVIDGRTMRVTFRARVDTEQVIAVAFALAAGGN